MNSKVKAKTKFAGFKQFTCFFAAFVLVVVITMCYNMSSGLALKAADANEDTSYDLATFSNAATTYMNIAMSKDGGALVVNSGDGHEMAAFLGYQDPNVLGVNSYGVGTPAAGNGLGYSYKSISQIVTTTTKYRLLRYNGEVFHGQVTNGKPFSEVGASVDGVGGNIVNTYCKAGAYYAGIGVSDTGDDSATSDSMRMMLGSVAMIVYVLAAAVNKFFGFCLSVAAAVNPFRLFGGTVSVSGGGVMQGIAVFLSTVANTINQYYTWFKKFGLGIVLPVSLAVGLFGWLLSDSWNKGSTAWQKMRGYIIKTFFIIMFIPLAAATYDEILVWLNGINDSGGVDGTSAIVSTFCDFENWALKANFEGFDDIGTVETIENNGLKVPSSEIILAREKCFKINQVANPSLTNGVSGFGGNAAGQIGSQVANTAGNTSRATDEVIHLLQRYARGDKVSSSKYATIYAPAESIKYEEALLSSVWYRYDPQNPGILYKADGKTKYTTAELDGYITGRFGHGWAAWTVQPTNGYPVLAMYNYMNSVFSTTGVTVYSPTASSSDYVNHQHYSVSLVGTGFIKYVFYLDSLILIICITILGYTYGVGIMFANFQAIFKLVGSVLAGMIGSMRAIATVFAIFFSLLMNIIVSIGMFYMAYDILLRFYSGIGMSVQMIVSSALSYIGAGGSDYLIFLITVAAQTVFMVVITRKFLDWKKAVIVAITEAVTGIINKFLGTNAAAPDLQMKGGMGETAAVLAAGAATLAANGAFDGAGDGQNKLAGEQTTDASYGESIGDETNTSGINAGGSELTDAENNLNNDELAAEDYVNQNTDENGEFNPDAEAEGDLAEGGENGALGEDGLEGEAAEGEDGANGELGENAEDANGLNGEDAEGVDGAEEAVNPEDYENGYTDENGNFIPTDENGTPLGFDGNGNPLTAEQAAAKGIKPGSKGNRAAALENRVNKAMRGGIPEPRKRTVRNGQSGVEYSDGTFVPGRFDSEGNFHPGVTDSNGALHEGVLAEDGLHTGTMGENGFAFDGNVDSSYAALGKEINGSDSGVSGFAGSGEGVGDQSALGDAAAAGAGLDGQMPEGEMGEGIMGDGQSPEDMAAAMGEDAGTEYDGRGFALNGQSGQIGAAGVGAAGVSGSGTSGIPSKFNMPEGAEAVDGGIKYNNEFFAGTVGDDGSFTPDDSSAFAAHMYDNGSGLDYAQMQADSFNGSTIGDTIPMPDNAELGYTTNGSDFYTPEQAANMAPDQLQTAMRSTDAEGNQSIQTGFASADGRSFTKTSTGNNSAASAYGFGANAHAMPNDTTLSAVGANGSVMRGSDGNAIGASASAITQGNGQVAYTDADGTTHYGVANANGTFEEGAQYGVLTDSGFKSLADATPTDLADGTMGVATADGSFTAGSMGADGKFTASANQIDAASGMAYTGANESFNHSAAYMPPSEVASAGYTPSFRNNGVSTLTASNGTRVDGVALSDGGAVEGANLMAMGDNGELVNYGAATAEQQANGAFMVMPNGDKVAGSVDSNTGAFTAYRSAESYNSGGNTIAIGGGDVGYGDGGSFEVAPAGAALSETGGQAQLRVGEQTLDGVRNANGTFNVGGQAVVRTADGQFVPLGQASRSQISGGTTGVVSGGKFTEGTFNANTSEFTPTMSQADISAMTGDTSTAFSPAGNSQIISADVAAASGYEASYSPTGASVVTSSTTGATMAGVQLDSGEVISGANLQVSDGNGGYVNYGSATAAQRASGSTILRTANGDAIPVSSVNDATGAVSISGPIPPSAVGGAYMMSAGEVASAGYTQTYSSSTGGSMILSPTSGAEVPGVMMSDGSAVVGANVVCADGNGGYVNYGSATAAQKASGTFIEMPNGAVVAAQDTGNGFTASAPISVGGTSNTISASGYGASGISVSSPASIVSGGANGNYDTYSVAGGGSVSGVYNANNTIMPNAEKVVDVPGQGIMTRTQATAAGVQNIESLPQGVRVGGSGGQVIMGTYQDVGGGVEAFTPSATTQNVTSGAGAAANIGRNVFSTPGYTAAAGAGLTMVAANVATAAASGSVSSPVYGAAGGFASMNAYTAAAATNVGSAGTVTMGGAYSSVDTYTYSVPGGGTVSTKGVYNSNGTITKGAEKVVFTPQGVMTRSEAATAGYNITTLPQGARVGGSGGQVIAGTYSMIDGDTEVFTAAGSNSSVTAAAMQAVGATPVGNGNGATTIASGGRPNASGASVPPRRNARPVKGGAVASGGTQTYAYQAVDGGSYGSGGSGYIYEQSGNMSGGGGSFGGGQFNGQAGGVIYTKGGGSRVTMRNVTNGAMNTFAGAVAGGVIVGSFQNAPNRLVGTVTTANGAVQCFNGVGNASRVVSVPSVGGTIHQKSGASVDVITQGNNSSVGGVYLADNSFIYNADKGFVDNGGNYMTASQAKAKGVDTSTMRPAISYPSKKGGGARCVTIGENVTMPNGSTAFVPSGMPGQYGGGVQQVPLYTQSGGNAGAVVAQGGTVSAPVTQQTVRQTKRSKTQMTDTIMTAYMAVNAVRAAADGDYASAAVSAMYANKYSDGAIGDTVKGAVGRGKSGQSITQYTDISAFADEEHAMYMPGKPKMPRNSKGVMNGRGKKGKANSKGYRNGRNSRDDNNSGNDSVRA